MMCILWPSPEKAISKMDCYNSRYVWFKAIWDQLTTFPSLYIQHFFTSVSISTHLLNHYQTFKHFAKSWKKLYSQLWLPFSIIHTFFHFCWPSISQFSRFPPSLCRLLSVDVDFFFLWWGLVEIHPHSWLTLSSSKVRRSVSQIPRSSSWFWS